MPSVRTRRLPPPIRHVRPLPTWCVVALALGCVLGAFVIAGLVYVASIALAARTSARVAGKVTGLPLDAPVRIIRDERGVPHIRAATLHDLYFAQGYVTGSDRLFQIDLTRRYVYGRLSELLGGATLETDERSRLDDPAGLVAAQFARLASSERAQLQAYADGVNAAAAREPVPPEYRALLAGFERWRPQDSLACGLATVQELSDGPNDVIARDAVIRRVGPRAVAAFFSLTDPAYDVPTAARNRAPIAALPPLDGAHVAAVSPPTGEHGRIELGSNAFAAGAARTATGRALLANDPHLTRGIPGIWHLLDLEAPGFHVAGATLAGTPGIVLGHNDHLAWGATNGTVAGPRVFAERFAALDAEMYATEHGERRATVRVERFRVRFGGQRTRRYLTTRHGFILEETGLLRHAVEWDPVERPLAAWTTFARLGRARDTNAAIRALADYPGPPQNFVFADTSGRVGYALAGAIPDGPWGLRVEDGPTMPARPLALVPFDRLPRLTPGRGVFVVTANNLQYGAGYPFRLSAEYSAPYRAAEITRRLAAVGRCDPARFAAIQADTESLAERDLASRAAAALRARGLDRDPALGPAYTALAGFDGRFSAQSRGATVAERLRLAATADVIGMHLPADLARQYLETSTGFVTLMRALRERPRGWFPADDPDAFLVAEVRAVVHRYGRERIALPYGEADAVVARHPLAAFGFSFWNGPRVAGTGGRFSPAVSGPSIGQSFRAIWDVGNWDHGGIDLPLGESGEPGSPHYRDLAAGYARHLVTPLPYTADAVAHAARATLVLTR
jgi:penicillin amidase